MYKVDRDIVANGVLHLPAVPTQGGETYAYNKCLRNATLCHKCFFLCVIKQLKKFIFEFQVVVQGTVHKVSQ